MWLSSCVCTDIDKFNTAKVHKKIYDKAHNQCVNIITQAFGNNKQRD